MIKVLQLAASEVGCREGPLSRELAGGVVVVQVRLGPPRRSGVRIRKQVAAGELVNVRKTDGQGVDERYITGDDAGLALSGERGKMTC